MSSIQLDVVFSSKKTSIIMLQHQFVQFLLTSTRRWGPMLKPPSPSTSPSRAVRGRRWGEVGFSGWVVW